MSNEHCTRSDFCLCHRCARTLLISSLLLLILASSSHGIECYSNEKRKNQLRTKDGKDDIVTCESSAECYETVSTAKRGTFVTYTAGCTPCENADDATCYSCKAPLCNNHHAKEIKKKHLQCFTDGDKNTFGSKTIYCFKGIKECYYEEVTTASNKVHYVAGCGSAPAACPKEYCKICTQNLCNFPDSMRAVVFKRHKTTKDNKKKEAETETDAEKDSGKTGAKKPSCKKVKDGKGAKDDKDEKDDKEEKDGADEECDDDKDGEKTKDKKDKEEASDLDNCSATPSACLTVILLSATAVSAAALVFVGELPPGC